MHTIEDHTRVEVHEDFASGTRVYKIVISKLDYVIAKLTNLDYALLDDIENGEPSDTPMADRLLGLETVVRRIEEAKAQRSSQQRAKDSKQSPVNIENATTEANHKGAEEHE